MDLRFRVIKSRYNKGLGGNSIGVIMGPYRDLMFRSSQGSGLDTLSSLA